MKRLVTITHRPSGIVLADGPVGWGITPFEGNFYIRRKYLRNGAFKTRFVPGFCIYKFLYVWLDLHLAARTIKYFGWRYWLPNPLFPFIWFRVGIPRDHPELQLVYRDR